MQPEKKSNNLLIALGVLLIIIVIGFLVTQTAETPSSVTQVDDSSEIETLDKNTATEKDGVDNTTNTPASPTEKETPEVMTEDDTDMVDTEMETDDEMSMKHEATVTTPTPVKTTPKPPVVKPVASKGIYTDYTASAVAGSKADNIVLFFHATWCPSCHALSSDINANLSALPAGTEIYKVDYDTSIELRKKYSVTSQHTLVKIDKNGNLQKKWNNSMTLSSLVSKI